MASAAEQLASSFNLGTLSKATELKNRIWFTIGALIVFRFLSFVPLPGAYWPIIVGFLAAYAVLATLVKTWFIRRWGV